MTSEVVIDVQLPDIFFALMEIIIRSCLIPPQSIWKISPGSGGMTLNDLFDIFFSFICFDYLCAGRKSLSPYTFACTLQYSSKNN